MITPVNNINSLTFKKIYENPNANYSTNQRFVIDDASLKLKTPNRKGLSLEQKYEELGWDFYFNPEKNDTVSLSMLKDVKTGVGVEKSKGNYADRIEVGTYNKDNLLNELDVVDSINDNTFSWKKILGLTFLGGAILCTMMALFGCNKQVSTIAKDSVSEKITNVIKK